MSQSIAERSSQYKEYKPQWERSRDAIEGQDRIKSKGTDYLPQLSGQDEKMYDKYKKQALFYNATGRTFKAYKGLIFRKAPDINAEGLESFIEDCTNSGKSLQEFAEMAVEEEFATSRFGVLVEYPEQGSSGLSQAEAQEQGVKPYFVPYKAESIFKPKTSKIGNKTVLSQVRLFECVPEETDDEFKENLIEQIKVLDLDKAADNIYRQRVFRKTENNEWEEVESLTKYPKMNGAPIREIPFYMIGGYDFRPPNMIDLVNVNLSHYIAYADHRKGVAWTTRPQPWKAGPEANKDDDGPMMLGGGVLWEFPEGTQVGMLEASGAGLKNSENLLNSLKEDMASIGARMLMPDALGNQETATEFVIKKQGENSSLSDVSKLVSEFLTKATKFAARWEGVNEEDISIKLNTDFVPVQAKPEDLLKMIQAVQSGEYAKNDFIWWVRQNELVDPTVDDEERQAMLETSGPAGM